MFIGSHGVTIQERDDPRYMRIWKLGVKLLATNAQNEDKSHFKHTWNYEFVNA